MEEPMGQNHVRKPQLRVEDGLYLAALGLALLVRLIVLGRLMLDSQEAGYAWQAYQVSRGGEVGLSNHPAYVLLTGLFFYLFKSGEVEARLLPVLVGSAVVLFPYLLRSHLGQKAALVAAFGLALDPLLMAYSRQAGSPVMALGFLALSWYFWQNGRTLVAGFLAGLVLMSGPSLVFGLLVLLAGWGLYSLVGGYRITFSAERERWVLFGSGVLAALLVVGTLFMTYPEGLSFMMQAFPDYFSAWFGGTDASQAVPMVQVLLALPVYQPLALLFGLVVFFGKRNFQRPERVFLMCAFLAALLLTLINPGRQVWMLVWALVPLWMLAGTVIGEFWYSPEDQDRKLVWGEAVFYFVLLTYWWFNLSKMTRLYGYFLPPGSTIFNLAQLEPNSRVYLVRLFVTFLIPVVIVLMTFILYRGWSGKASLQGATWGVGVFIVLYLVTAGFGFTADLEQVAGELWVQGPSAGYADELMQAIEDVSIQATGSREQVDVVYQIDSPLVHWLMRDLPNAEFQPVINPNQLPSVVLNQSFEFEVGPQGQFYSGQHHALQLERRWEESPLPPDFDRWLIYRDTPLSKDWVILWTRVDIFPLYNSTPVD